MKHLIPLILLYITLPCVAQKPDNSSPFMLGHTAALYSKSLSENRPLNIYLPEGYTANDTLTYPVIYLLDGSADEDFIHICGLVQYSSLEWVNYLPKSIVVGIATVNRRRDFTYPTTVAEQKQAYPETGHSDAFISFIEKELQPFIEKSYRTSGHKTIIGQSLGGLLETEILLKKPQLFSRYIIISPSLWWDNGSLLGLEPKAVAKDTEVYIGVGKEGLTPGTNPRIMEDDARMLAEKLQKSKTAKVTFDYLPEENHATIMHQAVLNAFKKLRGLQHE